MKELSIEEKAKRYDEILAKAKRYYDEYKTRNNILYVEDMEDMFPELKESEDGWIKKEIINYLKEKGDFRSCWIAWLEKQGTSYTKRDVDDAYLKGISDAKNEIEKQYETNYQIRKDIATFIFNYRGDIKDRAKWINYLGIKVSFVEKQGEQKSAEECNFNGIGSERRVVYGL